MINGHHVIKDRVGFGDNVTQVLLYLMSKITNQLPRTSSFLPSLSDYHLTGLKITLNQPTSCRPTPYIGNMLQLSA
jgi:hypothetical protein